MIMQTIYLILKRGKFLNQLFVDDTEEMFQLNATAHTYDVGEMYFYTKKLIAYDVANNLDARVIPAYKIGKRIHVV